MNEIKIKVERNNPVGKIDKITLYGFGKPMVFHTGDDIKAIEHLQGFLTKHQKKCSQLSEEIFDLIQKQSKIGFNNDRQTSHSTLDQGLKDVINHIKNKSILP